MNLLNHFLLDHLAVSCLESGNNEVLKITRENITVG